VFLYAATHTNPNYRYTSFANTSTANSGDLQMQGMWNKRHREPLTIVY